MSVGVSGKSTKDALEKCAICSDCFQDPSRIPRRMPCCDQCICQPCLDTYNPECQNMCPVCYRQQNIFKGIKYLPINILISRFLDVLKKRDRAILYCAVCPNKKSAMSCCVICNIYLCHRCLAVHRQNVLSSGHRIISFANTQSLEPAAIRPAVTVSERKLQGKLEKKLDSIKQRYETLSEMEANVEKSRLAAIDQINASFDEMVQALQQRRTTLLSQVEAKADRELNSIGRRRESHDILQQASACQKLSVLKKESTDGKIGVSFIPTNTQHLTEIVKAAGQVRTVDFRQKPRPNWIPETEEYNAVQIQPYDIPQVLNMDVTIPGEVIDIVCPHLEFDSNTASCDVTVSNTVITNTKPDPPPVDTGCRMKEGKLAITSRPLVITRGQSRPHIYHVKVKYVLKQEIEEKIAIYESALTPYPMDSNYLHSSGLSIQVTPCSNHKQQLCLHAVYDNNLLTDVPLTRNQVGVSSELHLCILLDSDTKMIHIVDAKDTKLLQSVRNVMFDKPLWVTVGVETRDWSDIESELLSGNNINLSQELTELLYILHLHLF